MLTWMEASRPESLTLWVKFCVDFDFQVGNSITFHLDVEVKKGFRHDSVLGGIRIRKLAKQERGSLS